MKRNSLIAASLIVAAAGQSAIAQDTPNFAFEGRVTAITDELGAYGFTEVGAVIRGTFSFTPDTAAPPLAPGLIDLSILQASNLSVTVSGVDYSPEDNQTVALVYNDQDRDLQGEPDGELEDGFIVAGSFNEFPVDATSGSVETFLQGPTDLFTADNISTPLDGSFRFEQLNRAEIVINFQLFDGDVTFDDDGNPVVTGESFNSDLLIELTSINFVDGGRIVTFGRLADINADGTLNNTDVNAFVNQFLDGRLSADLNADGTLNNADINRFVSEFLAG